ncbi:MAG: molybdopterin molybdenumtransferase MoeA [Acidobacteria bacterium]|nr:molybdopterin molybdenumtransferase MoeA [Acidobacteriota bacterium]
MTDLIKIEQALRMVIDRTFRGGTECIDADLALGRVLQEAIVSDLDLPPFDRARMDGYAFRGGDTVAATPTSPVRLIGVGEIAAGEFPDGQLGQGEAIRIMTGAPVPRGADTVERIEVIAVATDGSILLRAPVEAGRNITPRGFEVACGVRIVEPGERISPALAAVLATFGYSKVEVSLPPRVALISTGDELVRVDERPGAGKIRDSNTRALAGYVKEAGGEVVSTAIVGDDLEATVVAINGALEVADMILLSGGVSMGDYDLVKPGLRQCRADIHFERVAMHPGKPTVFATRGEKLIFGLPGNPVSVAVAFFLFVRPALCKLQGAKLLELPRTKAICTGRVKGAPPRRSHQPGRLKITEGTAQIEPLRWSGSGDLVGFMTANALIVIPEETAVVEPGQLTEIILLSEQVTAERRLLG